MSAQPVLTHNWFGDRVWRVNGIPHREDGPAVILVDGREEWRVNGALHREDGPARVWPDGEAEWWRHGARVDPPVPQP